MVSPKGGPTTALVCRLKQQRSACFTSCTITSSGIRGQVTLTFCQLNALDFLIHCYCIILMEILNTSTNMSSLGSHLKWKFPVPKPQVSLCLLADWGANHILTHSSVTAQQQWYRFCEYTSWAQAPLKNSFHASSQLLHWMLSTVLPVNMATHHLKVIPTQSCFKGHHLGRS